MVLCNILNQSSQAAISLTSGLKECGRKISTCMDKTRVYFFFFIPRGETDVDKPLIKGIPRYNEAECIPRRTYSDMKQTLKLSLVRSSTHTAMAS